MRASVASELWGEIALSRLRSEAHLPMRGKGDTYQKKKMSTCQSKQIYTLEVKMGHFFHLQNEALTRELNK